MITWSVLVLGIIGAITALTWMTVRRATACRPPVFGPRLVLAAASAVAVSVGLPSLL